MGNSGKKCDSLKQTESLSTFWMARIWKVFLFPFWNPVKIRLKPDFGRVCVCMSWSANKFRYRKFPSLSLLELENISRTAWFEQNIRWMKNADREEERERVCKAEKNNDENEMKQLLISLYVAVLFSTEKWQLAGGSRLNEIPKKCIKRTIHHNIFCFSFILMN